MLFIPYSIRAATINVLVFKTSISSSKNIRALAPELDGHPGILRWNVDLLDIDNVLRIETKSLDAHDIIQLVEQNGFACEELPD